MRLYPPQVKTASYENISMNYVTFGNGSKAFVMIPGISLTRITDAAEAVAKAYAAFGEEYTIYLFDRTNEIEACTSIEQMAHHTAMIMQSLGIQNADVFGASQGGMIAMCLAAEHPGLVAHLVLGSTSDRGDALKKSVVSTWIEHAKKQDQVALNRCFFETVYSQSTLDAIRDALPLLEQAGTAQNCDRFAKMAQTIPAFDGSSALARIGCPVLILAGALDRIIPADVARDMAKRLNCALHIYDDYGHAVYDEAPDFKDRMLTFFHD